MFTEMPESNPYTTVLTVSTFMLISAGQTTRLQSWLSPSITPKHSANQSLLWRFQPAKIAPRTNPTGRDIASAQSSTNQSLCQRSTYKNTRTVKICHYPGSIIQGHSRSASRGRKPSIGWALKKLSQPWRPLICLSQWHARRVFYSDYIKGIPFFQ